MESSGITSIAGGATQGLSGVAMGIIGYYQRKKAAEMEKDLVRPELAIPDYMSGYVNDAQKQALQGLPEEQRQRYLDQINRTAAYAIAGNVDRGAGLQGVSNASMALNDANANLLTMDAQQRQQNIANYQNAQLNYANFKGNKFDREFAYNQDEPYRNKAAAIRALYGAGMQNGAAGLQTVADSGATLAGGQGSGGNTNPYNNTQQTNMAYNPNYANTSNSVDYIPTNRNQNPYYGNQQQNDTLNYNPNQFV